MEKELFKDLHPAERLKALEANCDKIEKTDYMKSFSHDDIIQFKEELSEVSIKLNDISIAKKEVVKEYADAAKEPAARKTELLGNIKNKATSVNEECFIFLDQEKQTAFFYNGEGTQVFSRPLIGNERQKTVFQTLRAVNE